MEYQGRSLIFLLISFTLLVTVNSQGRAPYFVRNMNGIDILEDVPIGQSVYTLLALDPEQGPVKYVIEADMFSVDEDSGVVILTRQLDYESEERFLYVKVFAIDEEQIMVSAQITVNVFDANDNPAEFSDQTYSLTLPENQRVGSIISPLLVTDVDAPNEPISVSCSPPVDSGALAQSYAEACATFQVINITANNKFWRGQLKLVKQLDFETRPTYQLPLETFDGKNKNLRSFEIILSDINDTPPVFTHTVPVTVNESVPLNTTINYVAAVDGDINNPNDIRYDIQCSTASGISLFAIDRVTGDIINIRQLDRENPLLSQGYIDLCVKAREVISKNPDEVLGNNSLTTATATIRINVRDLNDNVPTFHRSNFTVSIREDIPNESALPGLIMTVTDLDSGTANSYDFALLDNIDVFAVFPDRGQGQTTASLKVIDTSKIDYERGPKQYILRVHAREVLPGQTSRLTGSTTVTVNVLDVNDNYPDFTQPVYIERILETKPIGEVVVDISVTDPDSGNFGVNGVIFGLVGNGAEKFVINNRTGAVTIAPCSPRPGVDTCVDYEKTHFYELTLTATDELGNGLSQTARLRINVQDVNDNPPVFVLSEYVANILEGQNRTIDPLFARANDRDTVGGPVRYSIEAGVGARFWQIDPVTAEITATQPIKFEDPPNNNGVFELSVLAQDADFRTTVKVTINVIDLNDNAPVFQPRIYIETIDESTGGNYPILTVTATDRDSPTTENGKIEYGIESGWAGKFVIDKTTGALSTASDATFDYDVQRQYKMVVHARDGGNPQLTGTASVTINIRDANNKDPFFRPQTHRAEVFENVPIGTSVTYLLAYDRDVGAVLNYYFTDPIGAITPDGIKVDRSVYNYADLFEVNPTDGIVRTKSNLDRDRTSVITFTMLVVDTVANPRQTGTGTLIINVLEYNDQAPYFQLPVYNITIDEEQPIGAFIMTLIARDEDDEIAQYEIYDDRGNYFAIAQTTGVLTVKNNIDYERVQQTQFMARARDNGFPSLSNTTRVYVYIRNINDNSPIFDRGDYTATILEHSPPATAVITVTATDMDLEDYGVVRYMLGAGETRFAINNVSGDITTTADLDREQESIIALQVTAYDSPLDASVRRRYTVPVYITLSDINDNSPIFSTTNYEATIIETIDIGAQVLQVFATDRDVGPNAILAFSKLSGDPNSFFDIGQGSGRITVGKSLRGKYGDYVFYVIVEDLNGDPFARNATATVTIHVIQATNSPPKWTIPPRANMTIEVLETQYLGMLVYDVEAEDNDNGKSGIVDYGFYYQGNYTRLTPEFSINSVTGVIRAEIRYDREAVERYVLLLSARDRGDPSLEAIRFLTIRVIDVNDNVPQFPMTNGETRPYEFSASENATVGDVIGKVHARDRDTIGEIFYYILAGDRETFDVNRTNGVISLKKSLDRERQPQYQLDIHATNNVSDYSVITERRKRSTDPSIVTVLITVIDVEDEVPVFTSFNGPDNKREYYGCISADAPFGKSVVQVAANDDDSAGPAGLRYSLGGQNTENTFAIDPTAGLIYNRLLVDKVPQNVFLLTATATDRGNLNSTVNVKVFKTSSDNEAKIVINQKSSEVRLFIQQLIRLLQSDRDIQYVCVSLIRDHVNGAGRVDRTKTDVYVTAVYGAQTDYRVYTTAELIDIVNKARVDNEKSYDALYITGVGERTEEQSLIDQTPVLAVLIIIILLIIMALILFCLACYCIADSKRKKLRRKEAERFTVIQHEPVKEVGPMYDNPGFERQPMPIPVAQPVHVPLQGSPSDEYAVVQKKRPPSDEFVTTRVIPIQSAQSIIEPVPSEPEEGPVPVIETIVMEDEPPVHQQYDPEPVIVTEIIPEPEPQAVYIPDPEPQAVYIPDPEPQAVYIPEPEPQAVYIPDPEPEPQAIYIPEPEPPHLEYTPEPYTYSEPDPEPSMSYFPEEAPEDIMVEIQDDTPDHSPQPSPPPSPKSSPPRSRSPTPRYSPSPSPRHSPSPSPRHSPSPPPFDDGQMTTEMM